jgi:hypothetical protein
MKYEDEVNGIDGFLLEYVPACPLPITENMFYNKFGLFP